MSNMRKWFGPSREEIWRQLSSEIQAEYLPGTFWKGDKVVVVHREWTITLDTFVVSTGKTTVRFTRLRAPYVNPDNFRFNIYRKSVFTGLGKFLGMEDVTVGFPEFDEDFVIKGNDPKVIALFQNARLRELISAQKRIRFSVKDSEGVFGPVYPENVDTLEFVVRGVIKDVARLKLLFDLFAETLDELCRLGSAYEANPGVKN
jgi:hypothetical protein